MMRTIVAAVCIIILQAAPALGNEINWQDVSLDLSQPERGRPFPDFELPGINGELISVRAFKGKPLFVIFCACYADTACSPIKAIENFREWYGNALAVVVVCSEVAPSWREHGYEMLSRRTKGLVDAVLIDEEGELIVPYLVGNYPTTYLMDEDFIVRYRGTSIADLLGAELNASLKAIAGPYRDMP